MMYLGCAWYPEHWPQARWAVDLGLMRSTGINVVRIGEYAWSRLEAEEGRFEVAWLEQVVDLAQQHGIKVVMCTPSDSPPPWLVQRYPEVLRVDDRRQQLAPGGRRHFTPFSLRYRELCARITSVLAERFAKHPNVLGWQIGNEFCMHTYDELTHRAFQQWLAKRYGTLANLNARWTSSYWGQEYSDWGQIPLPGGWTHPGLHLDFYRFMSEGFADFQRVQVEAIRAVAGERQWITHNVHCWEDLDFTPIMADLDLVSWDPYPGGSSVDHTRFGWYSDFCRTRKARAHWIMETQPGHVNWYPPNASLPRGAVRDLVWHFYAHGAEAALFWQWRAALNGQEQMHGALLAADGTPRPICREVAQVGRELQQLSPLLEGTRVEAQVAVLYSYVDQFALKHERHHPEFDGLKHMGEYYAPLRAMALDVDVQDPTAAWDRYRLVVAPHLYCLDEHLVQRLVDYVKAGGHLLLGPRSGFKDPFNALLPSRQPGRELAELLGAYVEEFHAMDRPVEVAGELGTGQARIWAEYFVPTKPDAQVLLEYGTHNGWIDGQPAMVSRVVGRGRISYLGAWLESDLMRQVMEWAVQIGGISRHFPSPPERVEVCRRVGGGKEIFLLINHGAKTERVALPRPLRNVLCGGTPNEQLELAAYGVAVLVDP